jgi:mannitol operon transcriptional antiterminator
MSNLTTRQRDLLQILLNSEAPISAAEMAEPLQLTARQVNYDLKGLKVWLARREVSLVVTQGVGAQLDATLEKRHELEKELNARARFELFLPIEQRQPLLALVLLAADEPFILYQLQTLAQVSRTTILKDLDNLDEWLDGHNLHLERRPNYGIWISGTEQARRGAIAGWLWGDTPLGRPLTEMTHSHGLRFSMKDDTDLLPLVKKVSEIISRWDTRRTFGQVTYAEAQLDGRFTDDAVLYLALVLAVQLERSKHELCLKVDDNNQAWLKTLSIWPVAAQIARQLGWENTVRWPEAEIAMIAMHLLAAPRNERWPGDLDIDDFFAALIEMLIQQISVAYNLAEMSNDQTLRDGIITHVIPVCLRHRFNLWLPPPIAAATLPKKYVFEHNLAHKLARTIEAQTSIVLTESEINNLALLLRAAFIRERPNQVQEVLVVCPSGMATAQLLVARLKARFPRLGSFKVISLRQLTRNTADQAEMIITTAPLPEELNNHDKVVQVHPMLMPEDIETITQWLGYHP